MFLIYSWRDFSMVERKVALNRAPDRPELQALLDHAKTVVLTVEQLQEQRASFVYGNAPMGSRITKESALRSVKRIRVTSFVA
jgi:hypothetical protein